MKTRIILIVGLIIQSTLFAQSTDKEKLAVLDRYFEQALQDWEVPGMAIAIVKDGKTIFAKGYGVRNINSKKKVDANTLFAVASNTKTFTATAIATLVDEGKLNWDDKVIDHLPWFKTYDPWITNNMTIRDLLSHHSGLETFSGDLLWYGSDYSPKEIIERSQYLKPVYDFRTHFGYSNIHFLTAGEVIAASSNQSWSDYIKSTFLGPLEMNRSLLSTKDLKNTDNIASPHTRENKKTIPIDWVCWDNIGPAGSLISSVNDYSQWLKLHLNEGVYKNDTIFSENVQREMWTPHTNKSVSKGAERLWDTHFKSYGLGFSVFDYLGYKAVGHNGGYDGFISQSLMIPEQEFGFVILTNANSLLYFPLQYKILDVFLENKKETDWSKTFVYLKNNLDQQETQTNKKLAEKQQKGTKPSLSLDAYTGKYKCTIYGEASITLKGKDLYFSMDHTPLFKSKMTHYHLNTWTIKFPNVPSLPTGTVHFTLDKEGNIEQLKVDVPNPDFYFYEFNFIKQ